jgi:FkbM family methyltransferase
LYRRTGNYFSLREKLISLVYVFLIFIRNTFLKKKRFIPLSISFFKKQFIFDKLNKEFLTLNIRDYIDLTMIYQIFYNEDYDIKKFGRHKEILQFYSNCINVNKKNPLIIDCGGNIGLATKYFSKTFFKSKIICIEPNENNIEQAKKNNKNSFNIDFLKAAVGSVNGEGKIDDYSMPNSMFQVTIEKKGDFPIICINSILKKYQQFVPFIIKIDIEGFESELFSKNTEWIDIFPLVIIELHDWMLPKTANSKNFLREISKLDRDFLYFNENIFSIKKNIN